MFLFDCPNNVAAVVLSIGLLSAELFGGTVRSFKTIETLRIGRKARLPGIRQVINHVLKCHMSNVGVYEITQCFVFAYNSLLKS